MKELYTVYYFDGREDHNLAVRADSEAEAAQIITDKYLPTLNIAVPVARLFDEEDLEVMEIGEKELAEVDSKGFYLYDQGT